ncbi:ABC transporter permease [Leucobacter weissii]|uniref:ABC transporter permease n=1 Tax=Leucobacter weissii TaxID=1983706 RepID=A0A939MGL8_9MICO|nr:ABC transporter permease [Leucobacter weissii]MBO1900524.1 ABC transporter permease [Leucobacter weissii]
MSVTAGTTATRAIRAPQQTALLALVVALAYLVWVSFSGMLLPGVPLADPLTVDLTQKFLPPGGGHWFGTDYLGRDVLSRTLLGVRETFLGSTAALLLGYALGVALGTVSGLGGAAVRAVVFRCLDVLQSIPGIVLPMVIVAALGFGTLNASIAVGIALAPRIAYVLYRTVPEVLGSAYVDVDRQMGASRLSTMVRHVLPNALWPALSLAPALLGEAVLGLAALGFLGLGAPLPTPEIGSIIAEGRQYITQAWWISALPGAVLCAILVALAVVGQSLEERGQHV